MILLGPDSQSKLKEFISPITRLDDDGHHTSTNLRFVNLFQNNGSTFHIFVASDCERLAVRADRKRNQTKMNDSK